MKSVQLNWKALCFSLGIFSSIYLGLSALLAMTNVQFMWFNQEMFELLRSIAPMLTATWNGVLVGLGIGLLCGIICGSLIGGLYNAFFALKQNLTFKDKLGRAVLGVILLFAGDYAGGITGGVIFLIGAIALAESIIGYCAIVHLMKR